MVADLSQHHRPITELFNWPTRVEDWAQYRITEEQIEFFHTYGYLAGVPLLDDEQIEVLRTELAELIDPSHPGHKLFYEFHTNESTEPSTTLFHALGAWRISPGFHDLLWNPAFVMPALQLLGGAVRFWHDQLSANRAPRWSRAWHQDYSYWTRTWPMAICRAGLVWMIQPAKMAACITCPAATNGIYCRSRVWRTT